MQGIKEWIPTERKVNYINTLLKVGFRVLDCGSFVSPKAVPKILDNGEVPEQLDLSDTDTKLSVIVVNRRGANDAVQYPQVDYLGFSFSVSEKFQQNNANSSIEEPLPARRADQRVVRQPQQKADHLYLHVLQQPTMAIPGVRKSWRSVCISCLHWA